MKSIFQLVSLAVFALFLTVTSCSKKKNNGNGLTTTSDAALAGVDRCLYTEKFGCIEYDIKKSEAYFSLSSAEVKTEYENDCLSSDDNGNPIGVYTENRTCPKANVLGNPCQVFSGATIYFFKTPELNSAAQVNQACKAIQEAIKEQKESESFFYDNSFSKNILNSFSL